MTVTDDWWEGIKAAARPEVLQTAQGGAFCGGRWPQHTVLTVPHLSAIPRQIPCLLPELSGVFLWIHLSLLFQPPCHPQTLSATGCCFPSPARMRSRLLFSVAHLPTIRETSEEMLPGGPGQEPPASPSLDDYVKSICQLAQPTSVLDQAIALGRPRRPHRPAQACENSCTAASLQDITTHFSGQQPTLSAPGTADPLGWLFGESQEKQPSRRDLPKRTSPTAGPWGSHRQMDSGKIRGTPRGRLCEARAPGLFLARLSWDGYQSSHLLSWTSEQPGRTVASPCSPCTSSNLRTLYSHLPVIHEL